MHFKDHFSGHASDYARYRPTYPPALFAWLAARAPHRELALDCGCGNGQAASGVARHFRQVVATDASAAQIANAHGPGNVSFRVAPAEADVVASRSAALITVAQALHWFDIAGFYAAAGRALSRDGALAVWTYELLRVSARVDAVLKPFFDDVAPWWPPERQHIADRYRRILPEWPRIATPRFDVRADWTADDALGYLSSWSAVRRCHAATGTDPVAMLAPALRAAWGPRRLSVRWPLVLHVFRRPGNP